MNPLFRSRTIARLALAWTLMAVLPMLQAQAPRTLNKHARKVYKTLSKYRSDTYLHLEMLDGSDIYGTLGPMSESTFQFVDSDSNATVKIAYANVDRVRRDAQTVRERDYPHPHKHLLPILLIGAAAAAGTAVYFTYVR